MKTRLLPRLLRGSLRTLLLVITLLALFWAEENWRGARAWQECKAGFEGSEILDLSEMPVVIVAPDDQNFMLSPAWGQPVFPPGAKGPQFPKLKAPPPGDPDKWPFAAWAEMEPVIRDLGMAARTQQPSDLPLGIQSDTGIVAFRQFAEQLLYRARAAIREKQPEAAADSIDIMFRLIECMQRRMRELPTRLCAVALSGIVVFAFPVGAGWTSEQCQRFEAKLREIDCLAGSAASLRFFRAQTLASFELLTGNIPEYTSPPRWWPQGWKDLARRAYAIEMQRQIIHTDAWPHQITAPYQPPDATTGMPWDRCGLRLAKYADAQPDCLDIQIRIDLARLALAVEHYRALHHTAPPSPDALLPLLSGGFPLNRRTWTPRTINVSSDGKWSFRHDLSYSTFIVDPGIERSEQ